MESFGFVSGICLGLILGGCIGMLVLMLLNAGIDTVKEIVQNATSSMPAGYYMNLEVSYGIQRIKVFDLFGHDTGYADNRDLELDARLLLAEDHAHNVVRSNLEEMIQDKVAA